MITNGILGIVVTFFTTNTVDHNYVSLYASGQDYETRSATTEVRRCKGLAYQYEGQWFTNQLESKVIQSWICWYRKRIETHWDLTGSNTVEIIDWDGRDATNCLTIGTAVFSNLCVTNIQWTIPAPGWTNGTSIITNAGPVPLDTNRIPIVPPMTNVVDDWWGQLVRKCTNNAEADMAKSEAKVQSNVISRLGNMVTNLLASTNFMHGMSNDDWPNYTWVRVSRKDYEEAKIKLALSDTDRPKKLMLFEFLIVSVSGAVGGYMLCSMWGRRRG